MIAGQHSASSNSSRRRKRDRKKKDTWLNCKIVKAVRKMKLAGLKQALKPGILWTERLAWIAIFLLCLGYTIYLTVSTVQEYSENPIINHFHDDEPIFKVPFPSTTITGTMVLKNNATSDSYKIYSLRTISDTEKFAFEGQTWTERLVNVLLFTIDHLCELANSFATRAEILNTMKQSRVPLKEVQHWVKYMNVTLYDNKNDQEMRDVVVPFLKKKTLDCTQILAACFWEGVKRECQTLFIPVQTDVGSGCSFNRIPDEILRKRQGLISLFHNYTYAKDEIAGWKNFNPDSVLSLDGIRNLYDMQYPKTQHHAGKMTGLSFMLVFDQNVDQMDCPIVDSYGYLIGIHSPFEAPRVMQTGITVPPNTEVFVTVKSEVTIAYQNIKSVGLEKRKCYFQDENPLDNFKIYTVANCHQECLGRTINQKCSCTLLTLSVGQNEVLCGPLDVDCVKNTTAQMEESGYDRVCQNPVCYSPCTEVKYGADVSYLPYYQQPNFMFASYPGLSDDSVTSIVHVAHTSNSVPTRERKLQFGFSILMGVIGGTWGMTLEVSMFTLFNVLAGIGVLLTPDCLDTDNDEDAEGPPSDQPAPLPTIATDEQNENQMDVILEFPLATEESENSTAENDPSSDANDSISTAVSGTLDSSSSESDMPAAENNFPNHQQEQVLSAGETEVSTPPEDQKDPEMKEEGGCSDLPESTSNETLEENNLETSTRHGYELQDPIDVDKILDELLELTEMI